MPEIHEKQIDTGPIYQRANWQRLTGSVLFNALSYKLVESLEESQDDTLGRLVEHVVDKDPHVDGLSILSDNPLKWGVTGCPTDVVSYAVSLTGVHAGTVLEAAQELVVDQPEHVKGKNLYLFAELEDGVRQNLNLAWESNKASGMGRYLSDHLKEGILTSFIMSSKVAPLMLRSDDSGYLQQPESMSDLASMLREPWMQSTLDLLASTGFGFYGHFTNAIPFEDQEATMQEIGAELVYTFHIDAVGLGREDEFNRVEDILVLGGQTTEDHVLTEAALSSLLSYRRRYNVGVDPFLKNTFGSSSGCPVRHQQIHYIEGSKAHGVAHGILEQLDMEGYMDGTVVTFPEPAITKTTEYFADSLDVLSGNTTIRAALNEAWSARRP